MRLILILFVLFFSNGVKAQLDPEYLLVLKRATTAELNAVTPEKGALVYNTDDDKIYQFNGAAWIAASTDNDADSSNELQALSYDPNTYIVTLTNGGTIDLSGLVSDEDWTVSGNDQYSAVSGNVGVGNPSPAVKLDVTGDIHSTKSVNIGPNATGSRLSIFDEGHSGSMLDIQTDDQSPVGLRILNRTYSADLAKSFRMFQADNGAINMSVGALPSYFVNINPEYSNGLGSVGIGSNANDERFLYLNRGTVDVGAGHYHNQANSMVRTGTITNPVTTTGINNYLGCKTVGDSATYVGNRNVTYVGSGAYSFRSLTGSYDFVYNQSTADNSGKTIYGSRTYAYDYGAGGLNAVYGGVFNVRKQDGVGDVNSIIGISTTVSKKDELVGNINHSYGWVSHVYGGSLTNRGNNLSVHTSNASCETLYGSNIRVYADSSFQAKNAYGININTGKYKDEITNNIYNINVSSTGYTSLINNYGGRFYLRDGNSNFGLYIDVANGANNNYAIYANNGISYFRDNVGIGTASPDEALHVAGNMRLNGGFEDKDGNAGAADQVLVSTGTGTQWKDFSSVDNTWTVSGDDMYSLVSGDVGVNTPTPKSELDVNGVLIEGMSTSMYGNGPSSGSCEVSHGIANYFSSASDNNYMHVKLPYSIKTNNNMYHVRATGYRYNGGTDNRVIDITWVGYCYKNGNSLLATQAINNGGSNFEITQYVGSDNHVYLRFRGNDGNNYFQSFRIESMNVGNGTVLQKGDIEIISSASATL